MLQQLLRFAAHQVADTLRARHFGIIAMDARNGLPRNPRGAILHPRRAAPDRVIEDHDFLGSGRTLENLLGLFVGAIRPRRLHHLGAGRKLADKNEHGIIRDEVGIAESGDRLLIEAIDGKVEKAIKPAAKKAVKAKAKSKNTAKDEPETPPRTGTDG